ncbi:hypothetical protein SDC9_79684 [bioreactor metagenome]|uniref:SLH domain-containing protein n=1 Tax=bioreactor metagenome TaxID=1076179 RepID=A0A644YX49_9ZZZZ
MKKRLLKAAVATALTVAFAVPAFANPFSDVPAKHWAYDSVNKLAQAGIVDGYGDGTFKGDKTMTRYEMAQIVAKAMNKDLNADQKEAVDKLAQEFSTELNNLGVKVEGLQKQVDDMVKISGDARVRYFNEENTKDKTDYRARINVNGKINDNMKFNARLTSGINNAEGVSGNILLDNANVTIKGLGAENTIGRQDVKLGTGYIMDTQMNGIASQFGSLKLFGGNITESDDNYNKLWQRGYGAEYKFSLLGADVTADYLKLNAKNDVASDTTLAMTRPESEFFGANAVFGLAKNVKANVEYVKEDVTGDKALAYGVKFEKAGLSATYRDVEAGAYTHYSNMNVKDFYTDFNGGFKGMEYQFDKNLDKNTALTVKHQDFEKQDGSHIDARTSAVVNVKF